MQYVTEISVLNIEVYLIIMEVLYRKISLYIWTYML